MSVAEASDIIHAPGHLIVGPTTLSPASAPNFGGTAIGNTARIILGITHRQLTLRAEEFASEIVEVIEGSDDVMIACFLRGFDKDAYTQVFRDSSVSTLTNRPRIDFPGLTTRASSLGSDRAVKLMFAADNFEAHPSIIIYNAIPVIEEIVQIQFSFNLNVELGVPVIFQGTRDSSGRIAQMKLLEDLSL